MIQGFIVWGASAVGILVLGAIVYVVGVAAWGTYGDWKRFRRGRG